MNSRRHFRLLVVAVFLLAGSLPAAAQIEQPGCRTGKIAGAIGCGGSRGEVTNANPLPVRAITPTTAYPFREFWRPVLSNDADGNTCIDYALERLGREPTADDDRRSELQLLGLMGSYSVCPDAPALPTTTPELEAAAFLRRITLPVPTPYVQPDALPVGFEAFLETGAPTSQTYGPVDTPFGPLTLTATADIYVDWDDPHDDVAGEHGPYTGEPGPHPDGEITHVYQHHGMYDIAVRYVWTASWVIGDITGTIEGVETSGSYPAPGFEAYSREAVGR
jgi:hypothetical protein